MRPGTVEADVVLAGTDTVAIGPADLNLEEGTTTIVYAWGSADDDNLDLAVQTISGMHGNPNGVNGGTGGQAAALLGTPAGIAGGSRRPGPGPRRCPGQRPSAEPSAVDRQSE